MSVLSGSESDVARGEPLLSLDRRQFDDCFDQRPFKISHNLCAHPLLQLPRLVELARTFGHPILYFRGDLDINQADIDQAAPSAKRTFFDRKLAQPKLSAVETVAQIESCNAWLQLRDIGRHPEYAELLAQLVAEFKPHAELVAPGLSAPRADVFVSSPGAITPFHLDEEHNFLLQASGWKTLSIADGFDPAVLDSDSLRAYFRGDGELTRYSERLEQHSVHVELRPGEGVHIPPCHPHWVKNGTEVSIALGILWFSDVTARRRHLYRVNRWLEAAGLHPAAPGQSAAGDTLKALPLTVKRRLRRMFFMQGVRG